MFGFPAENLGTALDARVGKKVSGSCGYQIGWDVSIWAMLARMGAHAMPQTAMECSYLLGTQSRGPLS